MTQKKGVNIGRRNSQSGYLLLPVAVAIALIGVIAFLISSESAIEVDMTAGELQAARAEYVAQAGLQHALRQHAQQGCGPYTDLTNVAFGVNEYDTKLTHDLGGTVAYTVNVEQDTWIRDDLPTNNYATDTKIHIRNEGGVIERPMLRYDLSAVPAKAAILSARAWFYVNKEHSEGPVDIHLITTDWSDTDATWDSMGANIDSQVLASIPTEPGSGIWVSVNLTAQVQAWINGEDNFGITINTGSAGVHAEYLSSESAFPPYIEVVVGTPPTSPAQLRSTSKIDGGGGASVNRSLTLRQYPDAHRQLRLDTGSGQDAMLNSFYNSRNYGDHELQVSIGSGSTIEKSLVKFDLPAIPPGADIVSARLELYHYVTAVTPVDPGVDVHRMTRSWVEGSKDGTGTADGATWDSWDGIDTWTNSGGDYDANPVASSAISATIADWESWEIADLVQGWVDGRFQNYGLILTGTGVLDVSFASREDADPALHPKLSITYACACGQVCAPPQGSGKLLMAVVNPTTLVAEDQKARELFESWGYTVSVISESANQAEYDTQTANNDVVFISETVNSNQVGVKLANAPIGVVSQDRDYNPDLGLASGGTLKVGSDIDITSTDHFITRPFPVGTLPIYTAGMEQLVTTGALTADQQTLAEIGGDASLVVLNQGDAMEGGGNAAGRRVILPLGTRYRFDWDHLNANGRLLVQRALAWGVGAGKVSKGNLLLVVVNSASLSSKESAAKDLIESWGFAVTPITASAPQADYDAALAGVDVVYVSGSISSADLGSKLAAAPVGVVSEDAGTMDEMGLAEPVYVNRSTQFINVVDNSHYITLGLSIGDLAYVSSSISVWTVDGALAPGLQVLGETQVSGTGYPPGVAALDTGASLWGGGTAAGRRVQVPWSLGSSTFDVSKLTAEGLGIMQRALEWGVGAESPDFSTELLFVVADPTALTGTEAAKQGLFESWGYTVNLIDDDAALADFQAATVVNGVAYVANTAVASSVGSKLFKAGIGVVNANAGLHDDFGFSTVRFVSSTNAPLDTVASHYITQPFGGGSVTLYMADQPSGGAVGTLAADLDQIGLWSSGGLSSLGGLVTLDAGAMTSTGENTPARRAQMPWDNLDVSTLTADGLTILQRALEWAGGAEIDLSPFALWKLDETTGPVAVDSEGGNDGTWTNGPVPAAGVIDGGLDFDGSNDYVDAGSFDVIGSGITMMAWFNAEALTTVDERIISKAAGTAEADAWWQLSSSNSGADRFLRMRIKAGGTTTTMADSTTNLSVGEWYLATATYDNASGDMRLYLNGAEVANGSHAIGGALDTNAAVPVAIGANGTAERFFNGILDDVHLYNRALSAAEIQDYYNANAPVEKAYFETFEPWSATSDDTWQTVDLGVFGVPANAVVEVAVINGDTGKEYFGGVRAVGSSLERRFQLHEAEGGGVDAVTMHVQADASSQIQHYSDKSSRVSFILLGYWKGATYVERFDAFKAGANASWQSHDLGAYGVGANQVAEIAMSQTSTSIEWQVGLRRTGSSLARQLTLHETEGGGVDMVSMLVASDASSLVEVYAEANSVVDFHLLGYWSTPPGAYTETGGVQGQALTASTWELTNLAGFGVPANSVAQFVISNQIDNFSRELGVREVGSGNNRVIQLQEAESGGGDLGTMHVNADAAASIEWYSDSGTTERFFYPVGWWVLTP